VIVSLNIVLAYVLSVTKETASGTRLNAYREMWTMPLRFVHFGLLLLPIVCLVIGGLVSVQTGAPATWRRTLLLAVAAFIPATVYGVLI